MCLRMVFNYVMYVWQLNTLLVKSLLGNYFCFQNSPTDGACATVSTLPDLYRRSPTYKAASLEALVRDDALTEGWYSLDGYELTDASNSPPENFCGTKYPIYLTGTLSVCLSALLPSPPFIHPFFRPSVRPSVRPSIHPSFHPSCS